MTRRRTALRLGALLSSALSLALAVPLVPSVATAGERGADLQPGGTLVGSAHGPDPYFPQDGNGGYDVHHYRIVDAYRPGRDLLTGVTRIRARALTGLSAFHLDLALTPTRAEVDGRPARFAKTDRHTLRVIPRTAIPAGRLFEVRVWYRGRPSTTRAAGLDSPFTHIRGEGVAMGEPQNAPWWFPANEHPTDKATFDISVRVPRGREAISNGVLVSRDVGRRWTTWRWEMDQPMATYLAFFAAGEFAVQRVGDASLIAVSRRLPPGLQAHWTRQLRRTPAIVSWLSRQFGTYPFTATGGVAVAAVDGYALETQTRPVYPGDYRAPVSLLVHELAHQWFGDSVSVERWRDIWLNEGFATYAEWLWAEQRQGRRVSAQLRADYDAWRFSDLWDVRIGDPGPGRLFDVAVYERGAMTLAALRNVIGTAAFDRLLRTWTSAHRYGNATGAEFRALAEQVSGRELDAFFREWLDDRDRPADTVANGLGRSAR